MPLRDGLGALLVQTERVPSDHVGEVGAHGVRVDGVGRALLGRGRRP
ncbi:hypothetical protein [Streptomyces sp. KL116D]